MDLTPGAMLNSTNASFAQIFDRHGPRKAQLLCGCLKAL
jgi:hypothetical protein